MTTSLVASAMIVALAGLAGCGGEGSSSGRPAADLVLTGLSFDGPYAQQVPNLAPGPDEVVVIDYRRGRETWFGTAVRNRRDTPVTMRAAQLVPDDGGFVQARPAATIRSSSEEERTLPTDEAVRHPVPLRGTSVAPDESAVLVFPLRMPASADPRGSDDGPIDFGCLMRSRARVQGERLVQVGVVATGVRITYSAAGGDHTVTLRLPHPITAVGSRCG